MIEQVNDNSKILGTVEGMTIALKNTIYEDEIELYDVRGILANVMDVGDKDNDELFRMVQNPIHWKDVTTHAKILGKPKARRLAEAIAFYAGGAELHKIKNSPFYLVTSKGYWHYVGA